MNRFPASIAHSMLHCDVLGAEFRDILSLPEIFGDLIFPCDVAIFDSQLLTSLAPSIAVDPTVTPPAANSVRIVEDHNSILRQVSPGEMRFRGARRVENKLTQQDMTTGWSIDAGVNVAYDAPTNTNAVTDFDAGVTETLSESVDASGDVSGQKWVWSADIRATGTNPNGTGLAIKLKRNAGSGSVINEIVLTTDYRRYEVQTQFGANTIGKKVIFQQAAANPVTNFDVKDIHLEEISGASVQVSSSYIDPAVDYGVGNAVLGVKNYTTLNGNTVAAAIVTEATGAAIDSDTLKGYFAEPAMTNELSAPLDFTDAAWAKVNGSAAADGEAAPDGRETADAFTASSANATILDALTYASSVTTGQLWLKRKTGSGDIEITVDGGATWTTAAVTSSWVEFHRTQTLANPSFGVRVVTSGDAVYLWGGQVSKKKNKSSLFPSNGTREADFNLQYHIDNVNAAVGSCEIEVTLPVSHLTEFDTQLPIVRAGHSNSRIAYVFSTSHSSAGPAGSVAVDSGNSWNAGDTIRYRVRWDEDGDSVDEHNISINDGATVKDDSTPVASFTAFTLGAFLEVLQSVDTNNDGSVGSGVSVKKLTMWDIDKGDAWLNAA